jgi:enterochelin esterase-like enzyme
MRYHLDHYFLAFFMGLLATTTLSATVVEKTWKLANQHAQYLVVLPPGWDVTKACPVVLAFSGGCQDLETSRRVIDANWQTEAEKRGWVVIMPIATDGNLFYETGDYIFPAFLDQMRRDFRPRGGKFMLAGRSNGGLSALHVAVRHPQYFTSVTVYPGLFWSEEDLTMAIRLRGVPIRMVVGAQDQDWAIPGRYQADQLRKAGLDISFQLEPEQGHAIGSFTGSGQARLFDLISRP